MKSLRSIAKEIGVSHSSLSKILNGKYNADPSNIVKKLIERIDGVFIPADKYDDILEMLDNARFPARFGRSQRTATRLYDTIMEAKKSKTESK